MSVTFCKNVEVFRQVFYLKIFMLLHNQHSTFHYNTKWQKVYAGTPSSSKSWRAPELSNRIYITDIPLWIQNVPVKAAKSVRGRKVSVPVVLFFEIRGRWMVTFTFRPLYHPKKYPGTCWVCRPQSRYRRSGKKKFCRSRTSVHPTRSEPLHRLNTSGRALPRL
jgi:hypothetical protein